MRVGVWVKLDICIYHEGSLSVRNEFNLGDSWHHETFHGTSLGLGEGGQRGEVGDGGFGRNFTQIIIKCK